MVSVMFLKTTGKDIIIIGQLISTTLTPTPITTKVFTPGPGGRPTMARPGCS